MCLWEERPDSSLDTSLRSFTLKTPVALFIIGLFILAPYTQMCPDIKLNGNLSAISMGNSSFKSGEITK